MIGTGKIETAPGTTVDEPKPTELTTLVGAISIVLVWTGRPNWFPLGIPVRVAETVVVATGVPNAVVDEIPLGAMLAELDWTGVPNAFVDPMPVVVTELRLVETVEPNAFPLTMELGEILATVVALGVPN